MILKEILSSFLSCDAIDVQMQLALRAAGCEPKAIEGICKEGLEAQRILKFLVESKEPPNEQRLRQFLAKRWNIIQNTDASYNSYPLSPANQACQAIAKYLAKRNEPIVQLLMPTLSVTKYDILGDELISLTETSTASGERELDLSAFLISENGKAIIPIEAWFESQIQNSGEFFNHLYSENDALIPFTENEKFLIQLSAAPSSMNFLDQFALRKKLMSAKGTLAAALLKLADDLIGHGVGQNGGTELQAAPGVYPLITDFLLIWYTKLTPEQRNKLGNLISQSDSRRLETLLLILQSSSNSEHIPKLTEAQLRSIHGLQTCVVVNSLAILAILEAYPDQFNAIKIDQNAQSFNLQLDTFHALIESIKDKLHKRKVQIQQQDENSLKLFYAETKQRLANVETEYFFAMNGVPIEFFKKALINSASKEITCMLRYIEDINVYLSSDLSIIQILLKNKDFHNLSQLLQAGLNLQGVELNERDEEGHSCLYHAIVSKTQITDELACALVKAGADLDHPTLKNAYFFKALQYARKTIIDAMLARAEINMQDLDEKGFRPLYYAIKDNNPSLIRVMVDRGADVNAYLQENTLRPINYALMEGLDESMATLLALGAQVYRIKGYSPWAHQLSSSYFHIHDELFERWKILALRRPTEEQHKWIIACASFFEYALIFRKPHLTRYFLEENPKIIQEFFAQNIPEGEKVFLKMILSILCDHNRLFSPNRDLYMKEVIKICIQKQFLSLLEDRGIQPFLNQNISFTVSELLSVPRTVSESPQDSARNMWTFDAEGAQARPPVFVENYAQCSNDEKILLHACSAEWRLRRASRHPRVLSFADSLRDAINSRNLPKVCSILLTTSSLSSAQNFLHIVPVLNETRQAMPAALLQSARGHLRNQNTCFPILFTKRRTAAVTPITQAPGNFSVKI